MKLLHELLDFAKNDPKSFIVILRWVVLGIALIVLPRAFEALLDFLKIS